LVGIKKKDEEQAKKFREQQKRKGLVFCFFVFFWTV